MARKPRVHAPGALYHAILRGNGGADLFFSEGDRIALEALVAEGVARFGHLVLAYCWMPNHLHLALQVGSIPLSKIVQNLAFRHARRLNRRRGRQGHAFQGRYKALLVDRDRYLLALVRYIHRNPVRAGLATRPEAYRWSSHRAYLGLAELPWLSTGPVLRCFGDRLGESQRRFKAFVDRGMPEGGGGPDDGEAAAGDLLPVAGGAPPFEPGVGARAGLHPTTHDVCRLVCHEMGVDPAGLSGASRERRQARARHLIAFLTLKEGCGTLTELSRRFGRDPAALHRGVERLRGEIESDAELRGKVVRWLEALSGSQQVK